MMGPGGQSMNHKTFGNMGHPSEAVCDVCNFVCDVCNYVCDILQAQAKPR